MAFFDKAASGLTKVFPRLRSDREIADYLRQNVQPIAPDVADETSNKPATMLNPPAIDFRSDAQLALLDSLHSERHKALFRALREDAVINRFGLGTAGVSNTYCNTPDAEIYAAMIMDRKPPTLIEVAETAFRVFGTPPRIRELTEKPDTPTIYIPADRTIYDRVDYRPTTSLEAGLSLVRDHMHP